MGELLNQPFRSESYDRLMQAQERAREASALLDARVTGHEHAMIALGNPIQTPEELKSARARIGVTQAQLASALGMDAPRISNMENGKAAIGPCVELAVRALLALCVTG